MDQEVQKVEGLVPFDPPLPGSGQIIALTETPYGLVAIRWNERPYILRPEATTWEHLKVN